MKPFELASARNNCIKWWQQMRVLLLCQANCGEVHYNSNLNQQQETNPKSQNFMGMRRRMLTSDSQQLLKLGKPIITKWTEGKPQSGRMLLFSYFFIFFLTGTRMELSLINKLLVSPCDIETNWRCRCSLSREGGGSPMLFVVMSHASRHLNRQVLSFWPQVRTFPMWCTTV